MILPTLLDIIDIFLVALLLYAVYNLMKRFGALNIFYGVIAVLFIWVMVSFVFKLKLFGGILDKVVNVGVIALIVLFQNEIRRFLVLLGSRRQWSNVVDLFSNGKQGEHSNAYLLQIVLACKNMSEKKTGALIVLERSVSLEEYADTGEIIDAKVSVPLLENIFFKNTPLHDGAVIISKGKLQAASCILPVASSSDIPKKYGLRHHAAMGIAQQTDAVAVVVSEETGSIALAHNAKLRERLSITDLERILQELMLPKKPKTNKTRHRSAKSNKTNLAQETKTAPETKIVSETKAVATNKDEHLNNNTINK